jgi:acetyltransferase-like isoleucine patch superfamily enzyme
MRNGKLESTGSSVVGCCIGHNCRIGAGLVFMPGRVVESDTIVARTEKRSVITKNVTFDQSDHHNWKYHDLHRPLYHPGAE